MKKKYITIASVAALLILGYLNYFSEEELVTSKEKTIETTEVKYKGDGINIDADKQVDNLDTKESYFEKAKAAISELILTSDSALLDSAKDLILKSNIFAKATNGWSFKSQEIKYNKELNLIESKSRVEAENRDLGVTIAGDNFITDTKMSYVNLEKNVVIDNGKLEITGDKINYDNSSKIAILQGNIGLASKNLGEKYKEQLLGKLSSISYDLGNSIITSEGPMELTYGKGLFSGEYLKYFEKSDELLFEKNVVLSAAGYRVEFQKLEKRKDDPLFYISGPVAGSGEKYTLTSDGGYFDASLNELVLTGNVKVKSKDGENISADIVRYNLDNEKYLVLGEGNLATYSNGKTSFQSKEFKYDEKLKLLEIMKDFNFSTESSVGSGKTLVYDGVAGKIVAVGSEVGTKNSDRKIVANDLDYNTNTKELLVIGEYRIETLDKSEVIISKEATYNGESGDFIALNPFTGTINGRAFNGNNIKYNTKSEKGSISDGVELIGSSDKIVADAADIRDGKIFDLIGNVKLERDNYKTEADKIEYNLKTELATIREVVDIVSLDGKEKLRVNTPIFNLKNSILSGNNFQGNSDKYSATSDKFIYDTKLGIVKLVGSANVESAENVVSGPSLEYRINEEKVLANDTFKLRSEDLTFDGRAGEYNLKTGDLTSGVFTLLTDTKDKLTGSKIKGNLTKGIVEIVGNFVGSAYNNNNIVKLESKNAKAYLGNSGTTARSLERVELKENSKVSNKNSTFTSNDIVADLKSKIVSAKNRPVTTILDPIKGDTVIKSDEAKYNISEEKVDLIRNVSVENRDKDGKVTTGTSENGNAKLKEKLVELIGKVCVESPTAVIKADKATYDTVNKKVKATGDVVVDYKTKE